MTKIKMQFSPQNNLGAMDNQGIAEYLHSIGDREGAGPFLEAAASGNSLFNWQINAWQHQGMVIGYIGHTVTAGQTPIINAMTMGGDTALIQQRIKLSLDKFHIHNYPGKGPHKILCEFTGKNQVEVIKASSKAGEGKALENEEMRFALNLNANDGASAAINGLPLFLGVVVGADGLSFEGRTVNVESEGNELILKALNSYAVKTGLSMMTSAQPALKPFIGLAGSMVQAAASAPKNKQIHTFNLGLDFGSNVTSAKLRHGSYIIVQTDINNWDWANYRWSTDAGSLLDSSTGEIIKANYLVIGVTAFSDKQ